MCAAPIYVIPSYQRADILKTKTLSMLTRYGITPDEIHVFIADTPAERLAYQEYTRYNIHYGPVGLHHMRNFITSSFPDGTPIVCFDDDIDDLVYMQEDETVIDRKSAKRYPLQSYPAHWFRTWIHDTFTYMFACGVRLFGIYPVKNGYFMKSLPPISHDLRFCVGVLWGCIVDSRIQITCEEKEDVERTLLYYRLHGPESILRFNHIAPITKYYKTHGGMQARGANRQDAAKTSAIQLVATFPDLCSLCTSKKSGVYEVKLTIRKTPTASCPSRKQCSIRWLPPKGPSHLPSLQGQSSC